MQRISKGERRRRRNFKKLQFWIIDIPFWLSLLAILVVIYDFGFEHNALVQIVIDIFYMSSLGITSFALLILYIFTSYRPRTSVWFTDSFLVLLCISLILLKFLPEWMNFYFPLLNFLDYSGWTYAALFFVFLRELAALRVDPMGEYFNPAQLFILSFLMLILVGTLLLLLPNATNGPLSIIDALFTSTSAVCVTGLAVEDTGTFFTRFGQIIIIVLVQIGGIGIMTFTSYFSYFFKGGSSFETQLILRDMTNSNKIAEVFSTLRKIILLTFLLEGIGGFFIYINLDNEVIPRFNDRVFFAAFHAISGFCNAGFSTLTNSLYDINYRFNYALQISVAVLFILGGLGFPIVFNFIKYIQHTVRNKIRLARKKQPVYLPWVINLNTRIVVITTFFLIVGATIFFYIAEYNRTLANHSHAGKIATAFFSAVTPRTAGLNTVDITEMGIAAIMVTILLMWIGGSPASTAGGIKTSTIAVAILNIFSLAKDKDRIEVFRREISNNSIRRASAIVFLSFIMIGISILGVVVFEPGIPLLSIVFECFSAFSTVGLSMGITAELHTSSKFIIIITMFIGRVGALTLFVAFLRRSKFMNYRYPSENILIN